MDRISGVEVRTRVMVRRGGRQVIARRVDGMERIG